MFSSIIPRVSESKAQLGLTAKLVTSFRFLDVLMRIDQLQGIGFAPVFATLNDHNDGVCEMSAGQKVEVGTLRHDNTAQIRSQQQEGT